MNVIPIWRMPYKLTSFVLSSFLGRHDARSGRARPGLGGPTEFNPEDFNEDHPRAGLDPIPTGDGFDRPLMHSVGGGERPKHKVASRVGCGPKYLIGGPKSHSHVSFPPRAPTMSRFPAILFSRAQEAGRERRRPAVRNRHALQGSPQDCGGLARRRSLRNKD